MFRGIVEHMMKELMALSHPLRSSDVVFCCSFLAVRLEVRSSSEASFPRFHISILASASQCGTPEPWKEGPCSEGFDRTSRARRGWIQPLPSHHLAGDLRNSLFHGPIPIWHIIADHFGARDLQLSGCCRQVQSDRERGEQLRCVPGVACFRTHLLAGHVPSQKTLEDIVLPEHGKDNWCRVTCGPPPFGPRPFGPKLFLGLGPQTSGPPLLLAEALRAPTFSGFEPLRSSLSYFPFFFILCIFYCFCFLSFFVFEFFTVFFFWWRRGVFLPRFQRFFQFFILSFFVFFKLERGKPKPQTSFKFGEGGRG